MLLHDPLPWLMAQEGLAAFRARALLGLRRAGDEEAVEGIVGELARTQMPDGSFESSPVKTAGVLNLLDDLQVASHSTIAASAADWLLSVLESQPGYERAKGVQPGSLREPCDLCGFFGPYENRNLPQLRAWGAREMSFYREFEPLLGPRSPVRDLPRSSLDRPGPGSCYSWGLVPLAYSVEALCRAGHSVDGRLRPAVNALLGSQRESGGWCRNPGGHPACTIHAVRALGAHPELRRSNCAKRALCFMREAKVGTSGLFALVQAAALFDLDVARELVRDALLALAPRQRRNGAFGGPCAVERVAAVLTAERRWRPGASPPARPIVSIVMPAYQAAEHVERAVSSILSQTFGGWELVAVDDGSADDTPDILARCARTDARIRLLRLPHSGIAASLNYGVQAARGAWIARMDADDLMLEHRLQAQLEFAASHPDLAITGCLVSLRAETPLAPESGMQRFIEWVNSLVFPEDIAREIYVDCPVPHPTLFFRRELLMKEGLYTLQDEPEDYELVLRLHSRGYSFGKVPEILLEWTDRPDRASRTQQTYGLDRFRTLKVRFLRQTGTLDGGFYLWGAGNVGKKLLLELQRQGLEPLALVDIDPDRIGQTIHGCRVISPESLLKARTSGELVLAAVGAPGARQEIRSYLSSSGLSEPSDFLFAA